jgi:hypothetical protein
MVALVILPLVVSAFAYAVANAQMQEAEALRHARSVMLAESLMEEIEALPYRPDEDAVLGPEPGENARSDFDSPNDFDGYVEPADSLTDAAGQAYPDALQDFARSVACSPVNTGIASFGYSVPGLEVTVTVKENERMTTRLTRVILSTSE